MSNNIKQIGKKYTQLSEKVKNHSKSIKWIVKTLERLTGIHEGHVEATRITVENTKLTVGHVNNIYELVNSLVSIIKFILFMLFILLWRVFLWENTTILFESLTKNWLSLEESTKGYILAFIVALTAGIIAQIIGLLIYDKVKKIIERK